MTRRRDRGLSLIEIMIVMAIMGLIMSVVTISFSRFTSLGLKGQAKKLASTARYLRGKAVSQGVILRLVYDIDKATYTVESTKDAFLISEEDVLTRREESAEKEPSGEGEATAPVFSPEEEGLLASVKLENEVRFKDIWMADKQGLHREGLAATYFFPNGTVTRTVINLSDGADEVFYAIEIEPLSGRAVVSAGYKELN